jgi:arylsulfatase A-like enzyme
MKRQAVLVLLLLSLLVPAGQMPTSAATGAPSRPNILIIVTDDQRQGLSVMPDTRTLIKKKGTKFTNAFVTTPLCCPSRASIFTGRYTHNHHVFSNDGQGGNLIQQSTLQYYLQQAGYETAMFGKYLNGWDLSEPPPYFDHYAMRLNSSSYSDSPWNVNGTVKTIGEYNTSYISRKAREFLSTAGADNPPWFLYLATAAPHWPYTPSLRYAHASVSEWKGDPAVFERDRSDKPPNVQEAQGGLAYGQHVRRVQFRTLMSVDNMVSKVFGTLNDLGEARNTLVFFISDNGLMWGEHGLEHKQVPYEQAIHVPFLVRWPGHFLENATDSRFVANIDIAPTVLEATGISPNPAYPMDGRSLLGAASHRTRLLTEAYSGTLHPEESPWKTWASTRTKTYKYTEYYEPGTTTVKFREYYDLRSDPWELHNLLGDSNPDNDPDVAPLSLQLNHDRTCQGITGESSCP